MKLLPRRALVALLLCLSLIGLTAPPAHAAYTYTGQNPLRTHSGVSSWTPRNLDFNSGWDAVNNNAWFVFGFDWHQSHHKNELGQGVSLEINAEVDCAWSKIHYLDSYHQGYKAHGWDTNVPSAALPFEDTIWNDPCVNHPMSGRGWIGVGVLNTTALSNDCQAKLNSGQPCHYYIRVTTQTIPGQGAPTYNSVVKLRTKIGAVRTSNWVDPPQWPTDCTFSDWEIDTQWNRTDDTGQPNVTSAPGLWLRMHDAGWCSWTDGSHEFWRAGGTMYTGTYYPTVGANKLSNQGLEEPTSAPGVYLDQIGTAYNMTPSAFKSRRCGTNWGYDGNCYTQFNKGTGYWAAIWQDVYWGQWTNQFTAEATLRCPVTNAGNCSVGVGVRSIRNPNDYDFAWEWVPKDGRWYICRMDTNHINDGAPYGFAAADDSIRWEVINSTGENLDIDYTYLGGKFYHQNADNQNLGVGNASIGPICTLK